MNCRTNLCKQLPNPSSNPTVNNSYKYMTPNLMNVMTKEKYTKFDTAYAINQQPTIEKIDYKNKNDVIHNNLGDNLLNERLMEYKINIDSYDRDINTYLDPFKFVVTFDPAPKQLIATDTYIDPVDAKKGKYIKTTQFNASPSPYIDRTFHNVKYVKVDTVVLPQWGKIIENTSGDYIFDPTSSLLKDRFITLKIKELNTPTFCATNNRLAGDTFQLFPDRLLGLDYYVATPYYASRIYPNAQLGNIKKLSVEFFDSFGDPLTYGKVLDPKIVDPLSLQNPLNKKIQPNVNLIFGIVESELNTNTQFAR